MDTTETWKPLLDGEPAAQAWDAVAAIAADLHPDQLEVPGTSPGSARNAGGAAACGCGVTLGAGEDEPGLADGAAGLALFFAYLAAATGEQSHADSALAYLGRAIEQLALQPVESGLFCGFTGVGWILEHLAGQLVDPADARAANRTIEVQLHHLLRHRPWSGTYDLVGGLAGLAVYALECPSRPSSRVSIELLVAQLAATASELPAGVSWFTPPHHLPSYQREIAGGGYYNLGVAHGVPGVLAVLGEICEAAPEQDRARALAEKTAAWLLEQEQDTAATSCFASWVAEDLEPESARLAWCYGDGGLAAALMSAARRLERDDWEQAALRVAHRAAGRTFESSGIVDAGLCHGAGGLGHIFNRLYQASGRPVLGAAARTWFQRVLEMRHAEGAGIGGFQTWYPDQQQEKMMWSPRRGFLCGAAGVALALLGAVSPVEPCWDRLLLTQIPPRGRAS